MGRGAPVRRLSGAAAGARGSIPIPSEPPLAAETGHEKRADMPNQHLGWNSVTRRPLAPPRPDWPVRRGLTSNPSALAWGFEAGTKMSTFAPRGHRGAPSHALGTHRHQSRFHRHFRGTFGHFRGNFSDFQGQKPENRGKSGTPENNCPTPRFTADCFAWGSRRQKIYGTRRWRDFKIFRI